jgi:hypothetical protein
MIKSQQMVDRACTIYGRNRKCPFLLSKDADSQNSKCILYTGKCPQKILP